MSRSILCAALLFLAAGSAAAQQSRIDPALRLRALPSGAAAPALEAPRGAVGALRGAAPLDLAPLSIPGDDGRRYIRGLAVIEPGAAAALERLGVRIGARAGDVVSVRIPAAALDAVAAVPGVRYLAAAKRLTTGAGALAAWRAAARSRAALRPAAALANDSGTAAVGVDGLRRRAGDRFVGLTGRGVIIGIVDTGLDLAHEDFRRPDGTSRVLYAWDETGEGRPPGAIGGQVFDAGRECTHAEIDRGECPMRDDLGHGTHVAGIAAGDGSATGNGLPAYRFTGVAPEADLIVVKAGGDVVGSDAVLQGVAYVFARAAELGRPAVVNLSLTTQSGPHDGTTPLERGLDALTGPGRIIVAGAGNQGVNDNEEPSFISADAHAEGRLDVGGVATHTLVVPSYAPREGPDNDGALLELWYDGADSLTVTVTAPRGDALEVATGDSAIISTPAGTIGILNGAGGPEAINGDHQALIALADIDGVPPEDGEWTITVSRASGTGSGAYHLWLVAGAFDNPIELARLRGGTTNRYLVGVPATADRVIGVAAFATKHVWQTLGGDTTGFPFREPIGDIAFFSSPGPRRDGVLKPEIAAPGKVVVSARAAGGSMWEDLSFLIEADGVHAALPGTSMAAPFVTGAVALFLQLDPELTPEDVRDLLARSARRDAFTDAPHTGEPSGTPNAQWGYGKLDVASAVAVLQPERARIAAGEVNLSANPVRGDALIVNYAQRPRAIEVYAFTGERVRSFDAGEIGDYLTVWRLVNDAGRDVANGAYILLVDFGGRRLLKKIFVLRP